MINAQDIFKDKNFILAVKFVIDNQSVSVSKLQQEFDLDYAEVLTYLDFMASFGYVSRGGFSRKVLVTLDVLKKDAGENF